MKPGRKSSYDLLAPMIPGQSPPPPEELEPDQQLEWEAITARLPVDWFTGENIPMLKELCRHITYARELAGQIMKGELRSRRLWRGQQRIQRRSQEGLPSAGRSKLGLRDELCRLLRSHGYQTERIGNLSDQAATDKAVALRSFVCCYRAAQGCRLCNGKSPGRLGRELSAIASNRVRRRSPLRRARSAADTPGMRGSAE